MALQDKVIFQSNQSPWNTLEKEPKKIVAQELNKKFNQKGQNTIDRTFKINKAKKAFLSQIHELDAEEYEQIKNKNKQQLNEMYTDGTLGNLIGDGWLVGLGNDAKAIKKWLNTQKDPDDFGGNDNPDETLEQYIQRKAGL